MIEVEDALNALDRRDFEAANRAAIPIASVGQMVAASKGVKDIDSEMFNPYASVLYSEEARSIIDPKVAQIWLDLANEQRIPSWAIAEIDMKLIRAAVS